MPDAADTKPFVPTYPPELPVCEYRAEIQRAVREHPVVVVCGDTGSGKTTQIPKMLLELGLGARGRRIACTQPRRLAAVTVAERVAAETGTPVGGLIGYQHRFGRQVSRDTRVKFMTDGVLLAETRADPLLRGYDAIIIDEAHERSLNVDFLLGILTRILARRRDLKVVVSSATLDVTHFSEFFGGAPVVSVPGRLFPVTVEYRPPPVDDDPDLARDVVSAVAELPAHDDILVFLPGERDIRETADRLRHVRGPGDDVIPLLASLPAAEQQRAFHTSPRRRIILATNVAETSVTLPGIRCVIDSGLARIARYLPPTQVQRLQIEPISQASARQRAGRCGRLGPGICIRLYSEEDFNAREPYTPPEVLRSSLAGVILQMLDLRLGDIARFPFLDPPKSTLVREGLRELIELDAVTHDAAGETVLTPSGRKLARIPVEPRLARMLLAASDNAVLAPVIPVVAALSCDDPRRRPAEERDKAVQAHAAFRVPGSDFLGTRALWTWWEEQSESLSQSKLRALCKKTYLSYPKMREWRDLVHQLDQLARRLGLSFAEPMRPKPRDEKASRRAEEDFNARFHRSLLAGLLGRLGRFDPEERDYRGANGLRFALHPSSVLAKRRRPEARTKPGAPKPPLGPASPAWIMAGELVDTARLFARNAAEIDPTWIEPVAGPLCRHSYRAPEWDPATGYVRALEQVTLHGLVIVPSRRCDYARVDPADARAIFIREGLVQGAYPRPPAPVRANLALLDALRRRAEKTRRPELFDAERLAAHFDHVIPRDVASADALNKWLARATPAELAAFRLDPAEWEAAASDPGFPDRIRIGDAEMRLSYRNAPDDPETDGITCTVCKSHAAALRLWRADWLVPGALPEKLNWMLSVLPSAARRVLSPLADTVAGLMLHLKPGTESLEDAVRATVYEQWGVRIAPEAWQSARLPVHLAVRYRVRDDETGRVLAVGRGLEEVLAAAGVSRGAAGSVGVAKSGGKSTTWTFGILPEKTVSDRAGWELEHYPALHDEGDGVSLKLYATPAAAHAAHAAGVARLYLLALGASARIPFRAKRLAFTAALHLKNLAYADDAVSSDILAGAVNETLIRDLPPVRDPETFARRLDERRSALMETQARLAARVGEIVTAAAEIQSAAEADERLSDETLAAVQAQIGWLVFPGFPRHVPLARLDRYPRYLKAISVRLARARIGASADAAKEARVAPYWQRYRAAVTGGDLRGFDAAALAAYRWMVEEYRVSVFAQELHTPEPVSPKRLDAQWALAVGGERP